MKPRSRLCRTNSPHPGTFTCAADENWLRESDLDFFARGPSEAEVPQSAEEATVVRVSCVHCCHCCQGQLCACLALARCRQRVGVLYALVGWLQTEGDGLLCRDGYSLA